MAAELFSCSGFCERRSIWIAFDLYRTLRTGRAHGRLGTITRKQEGRFQRYVWSDWLMLAFCAAVILWLLISPDSF